MKQSMKKVADALLKIGKKNVPEDKHMVYVNDYELRMLEDHSGPGEPDPTTGIPHFDDGDSGGDGDSGYSSDSGNDGSSFGTSEGESDGPNSASDENAAGGIDSSGLSTNEDGSYNGTGEAYSSGLASAIDSMFESLGYGTGRGDGGPQGDGYDFAPGWSMTDAEFAAQQAHNDAVTAGYQNAALEALGLNQEMQHSVEDAGRGGLESGRNFTGNQAGRGYSTGYGMMDQFGSWSRDNPVLNSAIGVGLGLLNPSLGVAYGGLSQYAQGNEGRGIGQVAGGLAAGPAGGMIGGLVGMGVDALGNLVTDSGYGADSSDSGNASTTDEGGAEGQSQSAAPAARPLPTPSTPFQPVWNEYIPLNSAPPDAMYQGGSPTFDESGPAAFSPAVLSALRDSGLPADAIDYLMRQEKEKQIIEAMQKQAENRPATKADIPRLEDYLARRV